MIRTTSKLPAGTTCAWCSCAAVGVATLGHTHHVLDRRPFCGTCWMSNDLTDDGLTGLDDITCMECGEDLWIDWNAAGHVDRALDLDHVALPDVEDFPEELIPTCGMVHRHGPECYSV